jgi:hypothetical protein
MSNKSKGSYAELKVRDILQAEGYVVCKAGGSLGAFDLVAVGKDDVRLVQVKYGTARLSRREREEIQGIPVPKNVTKEYWLLLKRKKPLIKLLYGPDGLPGGTENQAGSLVPNHEKRRKRQGKSPQAPEDRVGRA